MKINKVITLASLLPFLAACSGQSYVGDYVFQMGKNKGVHFGVSLKLTDEVFEVAAPEKGNIFILNVDMEMGDQDNDFAELLSELNPLTGSYKVDGEEKVYGETRLHLGISVLGEYEIPEEVTDLIFVANINSNLVNFYLPVSLKDLSLQLYWYGYDFAHLISEIITGEVDEDPVEIEKHPVGTHPTQEDIDKINETYKTTHGEDFRDYHVLELGLTRQ